MQITRVYCRLFKILFSIGLLIGTTGAPASQTDYTQQMHLTVGGERLTLLLQPSRVTHQLRVVDPKGRPLSVPVRSYIGEIKDDPASWVRLTKSINKIDGVISRHGKHFRIQKTGNRPARVEPLADNHDQRISLNSNTTGLLTRSLPTTTRVAKIALVVDSQFNARHNNGGLEYALGLINSVDGIFREEFGLALQVETAINVTDTRNDPFKLGNVPIETMLRNFRDYRMSTSLIGNNISMVHLFTGNTPTDEPVGLAWIDTACRTDGYDVGLSTHYQHDILLAAHELAHNLGALHDSDTACATSSDNVMWPYISSATSQNFSSCTVRSVKRALARSCHAVATQAQELALTTSPNSQWGNAATNTLDRPAAALAVELPTNHKHADGSNHRKMHRSFKSLQ